MCENAGSRRPELLHVSLCHVIGLLLWNSLLWAMHAAPSLITFRQQLNTFLHSALSASWLGTLYYLLVCLWYYSVSKVFLQHCHHDQYIYIVYVYLCRLQVVTCMLRTMTDDRLWFQVLRTSRTQSAQSRYTDMASSCQKAWRRRWLLEYTTTIT